MLRVRTSDHLWALVAAPAAIVLALLLVPSPAAAVPGLTVVSKVSDYDTDPGKGLLIDCPGDPGDYVVVGVGARVYDGGRRLVRLTRAMPERRKLIVNLQYFVTVAAEAPDLTRDFPWSIEGYAICAREWNLFKYDFRSAFIHNGTSQTWDHVEAVCPSGTVAYGAGSAVWAVDDEGQAVSTGRLGLQLSRTSGPLDITRATAREAANGYSGEWRLRSRAICAKRQFTPYVTAPPRDSGIHADGNIFLSGGTTYCGDGFRTHGVGGGGGTTDSGPFFLNSMYPTSDLKGVTAYMTGQPIGNMVVHHTCAI